MNDTTTPPAERMAFQTEVSRLLKLMVNAVYSNKEVFLRELISDASDACDKLRYLAITEPDLVRDDPDFRVRIVADRENRRLEIADNGVGMSRDDLVRDLGTIARSGTGHFVDQLSGDQKKDVALIGQFGVGFYSVFMVAEKVEVLSRRAGEDHAWVWESDGEGEFTVREGARAGRGTTIVVHLRADEAEWLEPARIRAVVTKYSDHIALPIVLATGDGEETVNAASALWMRPRKDVSELQYKEFYRHVGHTLDDPWLTVHYRAEGKLEYSVLVFVPERRPFDLFDPQRRHRVKLYVRRVFITEECEGLVPGWLRFLKGVVDSEDLPLNISREMLQASPVVARMRDGLVNRVLQELAKQAEADPAGYATFWEQFGAVLKEGLYEDGGRRDEILKLCRFRSTHGDGLVSLADYLGRMKTNQTAIYYISGDDSKAIVGSPQLEGFRARGVEVLLLSDPVDDFWLQDVQDHDGKPLRSGTRGGVDLSAIPRENGEAAEKPAEDGLRDADIATLIAALKQELGEQVKDVRRSDRLTDSAVCLVADDGGLDMHLERMLSQHRQLDRMSLRVLEVNPGQDLIRRLAACVKEAGAAAGIGDAAHLLLDQARIVEGEPLPDPAGFSRRLAAVMARGLSV